MTKQTPFILSSSLFLPLPSVLPTLPQPSSPPSIPLPLCVHLPSLPQELHESRTAEGRNGGHINLSQTELGYVDYISPLLFFLCRCVLLSSHNSPLWLPSTCLALFSLVPLVVVTDIATHYTGYWVTDTLHRCNVHTIMIN